MKPFGRSLFIFVFSVVLFSLPSVSLVAEETIPVEVISFKTSSTLPDNPDSKDPLIRTRKVRYSADKAFDNDQETVWAEGVVGSGIGETITIRFAEKIAIDEVAIMPGYFDEKWFKANNRIKRFKLESEDKVWTRTFGCRDLRKRQHQKLNSEIRTDELTLTILDVYKGERWNDTCLSELVFFYQGKRYEIVANRLNFKKYDYSLSLAKESCKILVMDKENPLALLTMRRKSNELLGDLNIGAQVGSSIIGGTGKWKFMEDGSLILTYSYYKPVKRMEEEPNLKDPVLQKTIRVVILGDTTEDPENWFGDYDFYCVLYDEE